MNYKLCIFDLDGTLTNTIHTIAHFANNALTQYGYPTIETERYKILVGDGAEVLIRRAVEFHGGGDDAVIHGILNFYSKSYNADFLYKTVIYDGILDLLSLLKRNGMKLAVLSNKPHDTTVKVLDTMFPSGTFDIFFGARAGRALKPSPEGVFEIIKHIGVKKEECIYIGDTATDMKTGKAAGIFTVGVLWGFRDKAELIDAKADLIVETATQLSDFISS